MNGCSPSVACADRRPGQLGAEDRKRGAASAAEAAARGRYRRLRGCLRHLPWRRDSRARRRSATRPPGVRASQQGKDTLYKHAIKGFNGKTGVMPAKGGRTTWPDDLVRQAVDHMVELNQ